MMSMFVISLIIDVYTDNCRMKEDVRIESCFELESDDYEWDEADESYLSSVITSHFSLLTTHFSRFTCELSVPRISDKQRLGLVRRYAPQSNILSYNYILI
ncbi:MAG: hypothetical protein IJS13_08030 [Paludibacteraceae bacterium]|nr:hypothetical protein [Paludibacteraceae bacterium]